jgi:hypothetical protein
MTMRNTVVSALSLVAISLFGTACTRGPEMSVAATTVRVGEPVVVEFDRPLSMRAADKKWVTLVPPGAEPGAFEERVFLSERLQRYTLRATEPGDYELRVHRGYPAHDHKLVRAVPITVEP